MRFWFRAALVVWTWGLMGFGSVCPAGEDSSDSGLPESDRALIVTIAGDDVTFTWESKVGQTYFILYSDRIGKNAQWISRPELQNVKGTGARETIRMRIPNAQSYRYSLRVLVPKSRLRRLFD
jgi:hypothetical protein